MLGQVWTVITPVRDVRIEGAVRSVERRVSAFLARCGGLEQTGQCGLAFGTQPGVYAYRLAEAVRAVAAGDALRAPDITERPIAEFTRIRTPLAPANARAADLTQPRRSVAHRDQPSSPRSTYHP